MRLFFYIRCVVGMRCALSPRQSLCLLAFSLLLPTAQADETLNSNYCAIAQQVIARSAVQPVVQVPGSYDAFVASKASDTPFVVQQYLSNPVPGNDNLQRTLSCKMRTAERINSIQGEGLALGDRDCARVHWNMLLRVAATIPDDELKGTLEDIVIADDLDTYMGPSWLQPWPFDAATRTTDNRPQLRSRALFVGQLWWLPMPKRFKGNHYCHLVAPDYLALLMRGELPW